MQFLKEWVLNIVAIVTFLVLIEIMVPSGKTKKFISLVGGFLLIITIITPVTGIFGREADFEHLIFEDSNFLNIKEIEEKGKTLEDEQMGQITELYRKKLIHEVEHIAGKLEEIKSVKADVLINEDINSENFGEVKRVYLYINDGQSAGNSGPVINIEKIEINRGQLQKNDKNVKAKGKNIDPGLQKKLEEKIAKLLNVAEDDIVISLE